MRTIELKDLLEVLRDIANTAIALATLIHTIRKDKRKTAPKYTPKHMRKR